MRAEIQTAETNSMLELHIYTEGDQQRGLGHLSRCSAYAAAWRQLGGTVQWIVDGDELAQQFLQTEKVTWQTWQEKPDEIIPTNGFAIVDSYSAPQLLLQKISDSFIRVVYIDDTYRLPYPRGYVIHSSPNKKEYANGQADWLIGLQWHPLRPAFWSVPKRTDVAKKIKNILVVMGATDIRHMVPLIIRLVRSKYPDSEIHVISSKSNIKFSNEYIIHANLNDVQMANLMCKCDLAISAAGQTTYEIAIRGLPAIFICLIDNQINQFDWWKENNIYPDGIWWNDYFIEEKIITSLEKMASPNYRLKIAEAAQTVMNNRGITNLFQLLTEKK